MRRLRLLWSTKDEVQHNVADSSPAIQTSSRPSLQPFFFPVDHSGIRTDKHTRSHAMPCRQNLNIHKRAGERCSANHEERAAPSDLQEPAGQLRGDVMPDAWVVLCCSCCGTAQTSC